MSFLKFKKKKIIKEKRRRSKAFNPPKTEHRFVIFNGYMIDILVVLIVKFNTIWLKGGHLYR